MLHVNTTFFLLSDLGGRPKKASDAHKMPSVKSGAGTLQVPSDAHKMPSVRSGAGTLQVPSDAYKMTRFNLSKPRHVLQTR